MSAAEVLGELWRVNLAGGAGILGVIALRKMARTRFGARLAYGLWLLPVLAGATAMAPARQVTVVMPSPAAASASIARVHQTFLTAPAAPVPAPGQAPVAAMDPMAALVALWLAGAAGSALVMAGLQLRFMRQARGGGVGPAVVGVFAPRIVTPGDFAQRYSPEEQALVLAHEQAHIARQDSRLNGLSAAAQCLCWFNPLAHLAAHLMRIDQELACDEAVVTRFPGARRAYAEVLMKAQLATLPLPLGCYWPTKTQHPLVERVAMLKLKDIGRGRRLAGAAALAALCAGAGLTAWAAQPADVRVTVSRVHAAEAARTQPENLAEYVAGSTRKAASGVDQASEQGLLQKGEELSFQSAVESLRQAILTTPELAELSKHIMVDQTPEGLRIQLIDQEGRSMFEQGSAKPNDQARLLLRIVARVIQQLPNHITLAVHTSTSADGKTPDAEWALSLARADAAVKILQEAGVEANRIYQVSGRGASDPLYPNDPTLAGNRRIALVLLRGATGAAKVATTPRVDANDVGIVLRQVAIHGAGRIGDSKVRSILAIMPGQTMTPTTLKTALRRLDDTGLFTGIHAGLKTSGDLDVWVTEKPADKLLIEASPEPRPILQAFRPVWKNVAPGIMVKANRFQQSTDGSLTTWAGDVILAFGEDHMNADQLEMETDPAAGRAESGLRGFEAVGNVLYTLTGGRVEAGVAVYEAASDTITFMDGAVFHHGQIEEKGETLVLDRKTGALVRRQAQAQPGPSVESLLRRWIAAVQTHQTAETVMSPALIEAARQQDVSTAQTFRAFGSLQSIRFVRAMPDGVSNYEADFAHGKLNLMVGPMTADGKLDQLRWGPIWAKDGERPQPGVPLAP
jgi:beta-lactamase regulating signal transducer with metallopeptidase domain/lipopolysaccharide export system protein LptA